MRHHLLWTSLPQLGLIGGCAWWLCFTPFRPERMLLPIPEHAVAITAHALLADRWPVLSSNPVTRGILEFLTAGADEYPVLSSNEGFQKSLHRLASADVVAAYVSGMDGVEPGAWIFTSWLGGKGLWFRRAMNLVHEEVERYPLSGGRTYWVMDADIRQADGRPLQLSFAFEEGLVVGCLSVNPHFIKVALACHDRNHRSVLSVEPKLIDWIMDATSEDRGWYRGDDKLPGVFPVRYELTELENDRLSAIVHSPISLLPNRSSPGNRARYPSVVAGLAIATCGITRDLLDVLFEEESGRGWSLGLQSFLEEIGADGVVMALLGGEYGGRIHSLRIPALVTCIPCESPERVMTALHRFFHFLSIQYGVSLQMTPSTNRHAPSVYSVTTAGSNRYSDLMEEERAAFSVVDGGLLISSSHTTLIRLLDRRDWAAKKAKECDAHFSPLWLEFDLANGGKSIRNAFAAYSLLRVLGAGDPLGWEREALNRVRQWFEDLGTLGWFRVQTWTSDQELIIQLRIAP